MTDFLERLLDESDDRSNFPIKKRYGSCDRVQWPIEKLNQAAKDGDWEGVGRIRAQLFGTLCNLEDLEE